MISALGVDGCKIGFVLAYAGALRDSCSSRKDEQTDKDTRLLFMKSSWVIVSSVAGPKPERPVPPKLGIQALRTMSIPQQRDGTLTDMLCEFDYSGHEEQTTVLPPNFFEVRFAKMSLIRNIVSAE